MFLSRRARYWRWAVACCAFGALAATSVVAWASTSSPATTKAPRGAKLTEAVVTAFTGPESFIGGVLSAGAYPAVYEINKAGGALGHPFGVTTVDTRGDPADALPLVERFLGSTSNIAGVVGPDGATANQLIPLFNTQKVTITSDVGSANFDRSPYKYFWRLVSPDPVNGLAMALWAKKLGYTRVALVFGSDTTAQTDLPGIQYGVQHLHLNVVANISLTPDQPSYQTSAAQLLAAAPQVIFTEEDATTAGTFFGDIAQLGTVPPIIGDSGTIENAWITAVSGGIGASTFAKTYTGLTSQPAKVTGAQKAWVNAINNSPQVATPTSQWYNEPYAQAAYDGVIIQALAMVASKSVKPAVYNSFIPSVTSPGAGKVVVYNFASGEQALQKGKKIQYIGVSGPLVFNKWHNVYGNQVAVQFPSASLASQTIKGVIPAKQLGAAG
jgi:ABC-type branched-subunit amino acid transport system substrate-binding protein